ARSSSAVPRRAPGRRFRRSGRGRRSPPPPGTPGARTRADRTRGPAGRRGQWVARQCSSAHDRQASLSILRRHTVTVIRSAEAPVFELPGVRFVGFAAPSRGCAELCTWHLTVEPGLVSPESHRIDRDEVFMVTGGRVRITPGGPVLEAGDAVVVPAGSPIQLE